MGENEAIVVIGRRFFSHENLWELDNFIKVYRNEIKGVILHDDKNFGRDFGESVEFFANRGVRIIKVWDKAVSDEQVHELEVMLSELI